MWTMQKLRCGYETSAGPGRAVEGFIRLWLHANVQLAQCSRPTTIVRCLSLYSIAHATPYYPGTSVLSFRYASAVTIVQCFVATPRTAYRHPPCQYLATPQSASSSPSASASMSDAMTHRLPGPWHSWLSWQSGYPAADEMSCTISSNKTKMLPPRNTVVLPSWRVDRCTRT